MRRHGRPASVIPEHANYVYYPDPSWCILTRRQPEPQHLAYL